VIPRKKSHAGRKFIAFMVIVAAIIVSIAVVKGSEFGKRVLGHREDRRPGSVALAPRFAYASATVRTTMGAMYNDDGTTVDLTSTRDISIDRQSARAMAKVHITQTTSELANGETAAPFNELNVDFTDIMTRDFEYKSADKSDKFDKSWTRKPDDQTYGTAIDEHYLPMLQDIIGFELRDMPTKPAAANLRSGLLVITHPAVVGTPTQPSAVTMSYTYEFDFGTFRRMVPILATRTMIDPPLDTPTTVTIGFDHTGLLRFADVAISPSVATTLAQQLGSGKSAVYHYALEVSDVSGETVTIDVPTNVVDDSVDSVPVDTVVAETP